MSAGDEIYLLNGSSAFITGSDFEELDELIQVYNLEVEDFHSYFVGNVPVLVHNYIFVEGTIPTVKDGKFNKWFNSLTVDELGELWKNKATRKTIESRLRSPGKLHEWLMVARTPQFKYWGITAEQIKDLRTATKNVKFVNPVGRHGGTGSKIAHDELLGIIDSSINYDMFVHRLNNWASYRLKGGVASLPKGLRI